MTLDTIMDLVETAGDMEEVKTNLMLAGVEYYIRPFGAGELIEVVCGAKRYRILKERKIVAVEKVIA